MDLDEQSGIEVKGRSRPLALIATAVAFACLVALFQVSLGHFREVELQRVDNRISLYKSSLLNALEQFQHLPFVLAHDPFVKAGAGGQGLDALNRRLEDFAKSSGLEAIYLMDRNGKTIAASNFDQSVTFLHQNYGFRPYFKEALSGKRGEFFAIGSTTSRPGYFIADPVRTLSGEIGGVIALKVDITPLARTWADGDERVLVSNQDGVVVLSSNTKWLYGTIASITPKRMKEIRIERQFGQEPLGLLAWQEPTPGTVRLDQRSYLHQSVPIGRLGWDMHLLGDVGRAQERAWFTVIAAAIVISMLMVLAFFLRSRRIRSALQVSQAARHKLQVANIELEEAHEELARSSKLAALGQLSASVTHELGQPISAMRNYLAAAELDMDDKPDTELLKRLGAIVVRMENIFQQLRFFARPNKETFEVVDLVDVWAGAYELVAMDLDLAKITVRVEKPSTPIQVYANPLRLEQVLVNLLKNALSVLKDCPVREIGIKLNEDQGFAVLEMGDTGPGLGGSSFDQLKEPFHTTKASGEGMGLGLAISSEIIKEHGGALTAESLPAGGARFCVKLPLPGAKDTQ